MIETIKGFKGLNIQSRMNYSEYYNSKEDGAESNQNRYPKVDTHTSDGKKRKVTDNDNTNGNSSRELLINRLIPEIIAIAIPPIHHIIAEYSAGSEGGIQTKIPPRISFSGMYR